jgi:WD40 repeat protein
VPLVPLPPEFTQVPARDPALAAVQQQVGVAGWAMIAWNEEGTQLASIGCTSGSGSRIDLRETSTGALIDSISLGLLGSDPGCSIFNFNQDLGDYPSTNLSMQWSPDGSHILFSDQTASTVTIWQVVSPAHG